MNDEMMKIRDNTRVTEYHTKAGLLVEVIQGLMCGYAECCIKFCLLRRYSDPFPPNPYLDDGVVMCADCAADVETTKASIISRRWLASPFPNSGPDDWPDTWPLQLREQTERLTDEIYSILHD
jgi:hypothetical protein